MESTDEDLVALSREGDMLAFKELVLRHEGKVAGVVKSMLRATPEADDVGQDSLFPVHWLRSLQSAFVSHLHEALRRASRSV